MNRLDYIKDDMRSRVSIQQVVQRYTARQFNKNNFCSCPFHVEKTASFKIDTEKQLYYCFGCGNGGDIFKFVQNYFKVSFSEAAKMIDHDFCLGLVGQKISVKAQNAVRKAKKERDMQLYLSHKNNEKYNILCAEYRLICKIIRYTEPLTDNWGKMLTKKAWLEYELDTLLKEIC